MLQASHTRRYSAFISYRHADNTQEGRRWAEWLHRALERYTVPPDLIGTPNLRGEPIRDSLYPIFRDEDELPANADLATGIRAALEVSDHLIVLCSPRSAVSPWVRKEVREFKELGRSDRILAIIIAGEPNADAPAKAREGIQRDEECFCEELRFGALCEDGTLDWTVHTEPTAADLRPIGTRAEGFVTAEAYREYLTLNSSLSNEKIAKRTESYRQQLDHALLKVVAGLLGVTLGQLADRDAAHRTEIARKELARSLAETANLRIYSRRLAIAGAAALTLALMTGWFWWKAGRERNAAQSAQAKEKIQRERAAAATAEAQRQARKAEVALVESNRQVERARIEEGRAWLEQGKSALSRNDNASALLLLGRAIGYDKVGKTSGAAGHDLLFPPLLAKSASDVSVERDRSFEEERVRKLINLTLPTNLPIWRHQFSADNIDDVAFSPDGSFFAAALRNYLEESFPRSITQMGENGIWLWDAFSGRPLGSLKASFERERSNAMSSIEQAIVDRNQSREGITVIAISDDCQKLAAGSTEGFVAIFDLQNRRSHKRLSAHSTTVTSIAFDPNGRVLASSSEDSELRLWNPSTGNSIGSIETGMKGWKHLSFDKSGTRLACSASGGLQIWNMETRKQLAHQESEDAQENTCLSFSPDGDLIVCGDKFGAITVWDATRLSVIGRRRISVDSITSIAFSPDGRRLGIGSEDIESTFWDVATGKPLPSPKWPRRKNGIFQYSNTIRIEFSPCGSRLLGGINFDLNQCELLCYDVSVCGELAGMKDSSALPPPAKRFDGWSTRRGTLESENNYRPSPYKDFTSDKTIDLSCTAISSNGTLVACTTLSDIRIWDAVIGCEIISLNKKRIAEVPSESNFLPTFVATSPNRRKANELAFNVDCTRLGFRMSDGESIMVWDLITGREITESSASGVTKPNEWHSIIDSKQEQLNIKIVEGGDFASYLIPRIQNIDLLAPLRGVLEFDGREVILPDKCGVTAMHHVRIDNLAKLSDPKLTPERRAELRMELCAKSSQFRAATALWQRLLQGEWPGFEGATVPKEQAPAKIPADSPIRRLYLLALIDATKHPQIHGHPTICQTAAQIAPVLTKEMMATPTISLAMMSLMQTLAKDDSPDMSAPRATLLKRLEEVAAPAWLAVLREGK